MKLRSQPAAPISDDAAAILLHGWGSRPPGVDPGLRGDDDVLALFMDGPGPAWRQHEPHLRAVARAWGWKPSHEGPDGQRRFYGEHEATFGR